MPACGIVLRNAEGDPVATALMAIADGIVITGNVITDPTQRRKGHGAAMMRSGLAWAHGAGATVAALNVAGQQPAGASPSTRASAMVTNTTTCYRLPAMK